MKLGALIRAHLPDFCWQTNYEVLTMLEPLNWDITSIHIAVALNNLVDLKCVECKKIKRLWATGREQKTLPIENLFLYRWRPDAPRNHNSRGLVSPPHLAAANTVRRSDHYETV